MPISAYIRHLRERIGHDLILLPGVAAIVRDAHGRVLLQHRRDNHRWGLPAGAIDPGEAPAQTLVREVWEEAGLLIVPERLVGVFGGPEFRVTYPTGDQVENTALLFECRVVGGTLAPRDDESLEVRYFAPDQMPALFLPYPHALFLPPDSATGTYFQWDDSWLDDVTSHDAS